MDSLLDEEAIRQHLEGAFELRLVRHRLLSKRSRLGDAVDVNEMDPLDMLDIYWQSKEMDVPERNVLLTLAREVIVFDDMALASSTKDTDTDTTENES